MAICAITAAYPAQKQFTQYVPPSDPFSNYDFWGNRPYIVTDMFAYQQPEAGPPAIRTDLLEFESLDFSLPLRPKLQTARHQKEEVVDVMEDVLRLMIDQRICETSKANYRSPISKRSINQQFGKSSSAETAAFTPQQLALLKSLKLEDIKELIKLLFPPEATNNTAPVQQEQPPSTPPMFYLPFMEWHSAPQMPVLPPNPYIQHELPPFHPFEHQISYEPFKPADEAQFQYMLNSLPPLPSPFVYSIQISAPMSTNQETENLLSAVPNSPIKSKPLPPKPHTTVTPSPQAVSIAQKLASIFFQSKIIQSEETTTSGPATSTEKSQADLGAQPSNTLEDAAKISNSTKLKGDAVKTKSAADESGEAQPAENELLEAFRAIRENLMKNNACKMTKLTRRATNDPIVYFRSQIHPNYPSRHAIPPANFPGKRHNPVKILYHKHAPHAPIHTDTW